MNWKELVQLGKKDIKDNKIESAIELFRDALKLKPKNPNLNFIVAMEFIKLGLLDDAEVLLNKLTLNDERLPIVLEGLGAIASQKNNTNHAVEYFMQAYSLNRDVKLAYKISKEFYKLNQIEDAKKMLKDCILLDPIFYLAYKDLARIEEENHQYESAISNYQKALEIKYEPKLLKKKINLLIKLNRFDDALLSINSLIELQPNTPEHLLSKGQIHRKLGQLELASEAFQKAYYLKPQQPILIDLIKALIANRKLSEAKQFIIQSLDTYVSCGAIWHELGKIAEHEDQPEDAIEAYKNGIKNQPDYLPNYKSLIIELLKVGDVNQAEVIIENGVQSIAEAYQLTPLKARILRTKGAYEEAIDFASKALNENPKDHETASFLIQTLASMGLFENAEQVLNSITSIPPFSKAMLNFSLAQNQFKLDEAMSYINQAIAIKPDLPSLRNQLALNRIMASQPDEAKNQIKIYSSLCKNHPSTRINAIANGGIQNKILREILANPFAVKAIQESQKLPISKQADALAKILEDEPNHIGAAHALVILLKQLGVLDNPNPIDPRQNDSLIPLQIVQFWDDSDIPEDVLLTMQSWPNVCEGYIHHIFNDQTAKSFITKNLDADILRAFNMSNQPAMRADLFRLAYLYVNGGIYADADDLLRHPLDSWLTSGCDLILLQEDLGSIGNNFIAAKPNHPFIAAALESIAYNINQKQGDNIWFISGPGALTQVFCNFYKNELKNSKLPNGILIIDKFKCQQKISMHLPRSYKQDARHWLSPKAANKSLFRQIIKKSQLS